MTLRSSGAELKADQKVMLLYESANFDPAHFADARDVRRHPATQRPPRLRLRRPLLPRQALARVEMTVMIDRLLARLPDMELATDVALPRREATFISGFESMPVRFSPSRRLLAE